MDFSTSQEIICEFFCCSYVKSCRDSWSVPIFGHSAEHWTGEIKSPEKKQKRRNSEREPSPPFLTID